MVEPDAVLRPLQPHRLRLGKHLDGGRGTPTPEEAAILQPLVDEGLLPASILTDPAVLPPTSSADRQLDRKNLRAASALLDEAGWTVGDDGKRRNAAGQVLTLEVLNDNRNSNASSRPSWKT